MEFCEFITNERQRQGLSQSKLAVKAKVSRELISKIERGIYSPRIITARKICEALQVVYSIDAEVENGETEKRAL